MSFIPTKGEWTANLAGKSRVHASVTADGKAVATFKVSKTCPAAQANSNALLCARAMDLLTLCEAMSTAMDGSNAAEKALLEEIKATFKEVK